ncbi:family 16 glycoside hydrolase [Chryseobacterium oranimense]
MEINNLKGKNIVRVIKDSTVKQADEPTFVRVKNTNFKNGIIEIEVLSRLLPTASPTDRGFIGLAFRINDTNSRFESIYIRPANGRAEDQVRRNHSIQYFSFPDYKYERLRKENPEKYESYADMGLNEWIKMKIEVEGSQARLFLNKDKHPSLIVNDLKQGADGSGAVGLFVDVGTDGYFRNLKITSSN